MPGQDLCRRSPRQIRQASADSAKRFPLPLRSSLRSAREHVYSALDGASYSGFLMTPPLLVLFCRRPNAGSPIQGLNTAAPLCCTSCTLRVTRCMSCSSAVAASIVSITGGVCPVARLTAPLIAPHRCTRASLTGGSWPANRASSAASAASIRGRMAPCRAGWPARPPRWCPAAGRSQGDIAAEITLAFDAHLPKPQPLKERDQRLLRRRGRQQARQLLDGDHHDGVLAAHHHVLRTVGARPRAHQQQTLPARLPQSCQKLFWPGVEPRQSRYLNNRAEVSHQSTRRRERQMQRFKSAHHAQRFLSTLSSTLAILLANQTAIYQRFGARTCPCVGLLAGWRPPSRHFERQEPRLQFSKINYLLELSDLENGQSRA